jgi:cytochrome c-type biogenesis protein CcmH
VSASFSSTPAKGRSPLAAAFVFLCVSALPALAVDTEQPFSDPALQQRYEHLIRELRCLVCQNETIADSNADLAADLRREVHGMIAAGKSDAEIRAFLTDRYGDFVLYRPPLTRDTLLLWAAPALLLGIGVFVAFRVVSRRSRLVAEDGDEPDDAAGQV